MGRIKSTPVKKLGNELIKESKDKYSLDFTKNKSVIREAREIKSKKTLNLVAGYITNEMKKTKSNEERLSRRADFRSQRDNSDS
ncbi:MAG: 30S ribosomal protein S17e [Candidatus Aenigmarchaeota archaeon]|nr:30S ribosomal protein S17e [Candidatus Aenigmarchaeota archaeon]